jgi:hypothetical protein
MADPADTIAKLICCPTFDGQVQNFLTWYMRFETFAYNNGFEKAITIATDPWMPAGQDVPLLADQQIANEEEAAKKENKDAYAYLSACLLSARDLHYVGKARTATWPRGLACHVIDAMFTYYKPNDMTAMADGTSKLMAPKSNLSDLFTTVVDIQNKHKSATNHIAQTMLIPSVLRAVPDAYKAELELS